MGFDKINTDDLEKEVFNQPEIAFKKNTLKEFSHRRIDVEINESGIDLVYIIFSFQKICEKYKIDYECCLVLLYLYELGVFKKLIKVYSKRIHIKDYVILGFVKESKIGPDNNLYELNRKGNKVVKELFLLDKSRVALENRSSKLDTSLSLKKALSDYFK